MEIIRFISESVKIDDIPENLGRLFIFYNDEKLLSDLLKKIDINPELGNERVIPEGKSQFDIGSKRLIINNVIGEGVVSGFKESKH